MQELAAKLSRAEQVNAELRAQLARIQTTPTDLTEQQKATSVSLAHHQPSTPPPLVSGKLVLSRQRRLPIWQISLLVLLILLIGGGAGTFTIYRAFHAKSARQLTEFSIPTAHSFPGSITAGPDGNLWFTDGSNGSINKIGYITPGGSITAFSLQTLNSGIDIIVAGPDGNFWFTETYANQIGRITLNGSITEFALPIASSAPQDIVAGHDDNLWFIEEGTNQIGRITPNGSFAEFSFRAPYSVQG